MYGFKTLALIRSIVSNIEISVEITHLWSLFFNAVITSAISSLEDGSESEGMVVGRKEEKSVKKKDASRLFKEPGIQQRQIK